MIARIWRGITLKTKAGKYLEYLNDTVVPRYREAEGNLGLFILRDFQGELAYFLLLSFWSSRDALVKFAHPNVDIAVQDPEEKEFLVAFESIVKHYRLVSYSHEEGIFEHEGLEVIPTG